VPSASRVVTIGQPSSGIPGRVPDDPFTLRQVDQARTDFAIIEDELEAIHRRLSELPTRNEVWRAAMLGMIGGAVAAVTLIEAFAQACR